MKAWGFGVLAALLFWAAAGVSVCFAEEPALTRCSFQSAGGMRGGHLTMEISLQPDGKAKVTLDAQDHYGDPEIRRVVEVPKEKLDELAAAFCRDELFRWAESPKCAEDVLDADTVIVRFRYADRSEAELADYLDMPPDAFDAVRKVHTFLRKFFKDVQLEKRASRKLCL